MSFKTKVLFDMHICLVTSLGCSLDLQYLPRCSTYLIDLDDQDLISDRDKLIINNQRSEVYPRHCLVEERVSRTAQIMGMKPWDT